MKENKIQRPIYREVQKFRQVWVLIVVMAAAGLQWYAAVEQLVFHRPFGDNPMPDSVLVIFWLLIGIGLPVLFIFGQFVTEVHADGIYIRFFPFRRLFRKFAFSEIIICLKSIFSSRWSITLSVAVGMAV